MSILLKLADLENYGVERGLFQQGCKRGTFQQQRDKDVYSNRVWQKRHFPTAGERVNFSDIWEQ